MKTNIDHGSKRFAIPCIGAVLWDVIGRSPVAMSSRRDIPGRISHLPGGVALNVAVALTRHGVPAQVLGAVGRDAEGDALIAAAEGLGVDCGMLIRDHGQPTDVYMAIEDARGLIAAIADAHSLEAADDAVLSPFRDGRLGGERAYTGPVVLDGNLTEDLIERITLMPELAAADLRVVPASPGKAERLMPLIKARRGVLYLNRYEAEVLAMQKFANASDAADAIVAMGAPRTLVTDGDQCVACAMAGAETLSVTPPTVEIARVTGAGDTFLAAHLAAELRGESRQTALEVATSAAALHVSGKDPQ